MIFLYLYLSSHNPERIIGKSTGHSETKPCDGGIINKRAESPKCNISKICHKVYQKLRLELAPQLAGQLFVLPLQGLHKGSLCSTGFRFAIPCAVTYRNFAPEVFHSTSK